MSDMVGNPEDRFSRVLAQVIYSLHEELISDFARKFVTENHGY